MPTPGIAIRRKAADEDLSSKISSLETPPAAFRVERSRSYNVMDSYYSSTRGLELYSFSSGEQVLRGLHDDTSPEDEIQPAKVAQQVRGANPASPQTPISSSPTGNVFSRKAIPAKGDGVIRSLLRSVSSKAHSRQRSEVNTESNRAVISSSMNLEDASNRMAEPKTNGSPRGEFARSEERRPRQLEPSFVYKKTEGSSFTDRQTHFDQIRPHTSDATTAASKRKPVPLKSALERHPIITPPRTTYSSASNDKPFGDARSPIMVVSPKVISPATFENKRVVSLPESSLRTASQGSTAIASGTDSGIDLSNSDAVTSPHPTEENRPSRTSWRDRYRPRSRSASVGARNDTVPDPNSATTDHSVIGWIRRRSRSRSSSVSTIRRTPMNNNNNQEMSPEPEENEVLKRIHQLQELRKNRRTSEAGKDATQTKVSESNSDNKKDRHEQIDAKDKIDSRLDYAETSSKNNPEMVGNKFPRPDVAEPNIISKSKTRQRSASDCTVAYSANKFTNHSVDDSFKGPVRSWTEVIRRKMAAVAQPLSIHTLNTQTPQFRPQPRTTMSAPVDVNSATRQRPQHRSNKSSDSTDSKQIQIQIRPEYNYAKALRQLDKQALDTSDKSSSTRRKSETSDDGTGQSIAIISEYRGTNIDEDITAFLEHPRLNQTVKHPKTGRTIAFSEVGDPNGAAVFVCVGMGLTRFVSAFWDDLAKSLGLRLITPDRPGIGKSEAYTSRDTTGVLSWHQDVNAICQKLDITEFSLLAHSAGVVYALATALVLPHFVRGKIYCLATWIPPSQFTMSPSTSPIADSNLVNETTVACLPRSQRFLRVLPVSILKVANSGFLTINTTPVLQSRTSNSPASRPTSRPSTPDALLPHNSSSTSLPISANRPSALFRRVSRASRISTPSSATANDSSLHTSVSLSPYDHQEKEVRDEETYNSLLTQRIWDAAVRSSNPATDLIVCLESKAVVGFKYTDILPDLVFIHGDEDKRVKLDNIRWIISRIDAARRNRKALNGEQVTMPGEKAGAHIKQSLLDFARSGEDGPCELRILTGQGHNLMANAGVMADVLAEIGLDRRKSARRKT